MTVQFFIVSFAGLIFIALLLGSGYLWVRLGLRLAERTELLAARFRSETATVPWFVTGLAGVYLSMMLRHLVAASNQPISPQPEEIIPLLWGSIIQGMLVIAVFGISLVVLVPRKTDFYRLGFRSDDLEGQCHDGFLGFVAALVPVFSVIALSMPLRSLEKTHPFLQLLNEQGVGPEFIPVVLAAVVIAPLSEELIFRVILQSSLVRWFGVKTGIVVTAVLFAAVHGFPDCLGLLPLALILGYVYQKRRSFLSVVLLHSLFNALNISMVFLQKAAESISQTTEVIP